MGNVQAIKDDTTKHSTKIITAGQLLEKRFPKREFILEPWLRNVESSMIWAPTGVGKTWMTLSIAVAIAGGGKLGKWEASATRKVLIIDGEMNGQDLQERIKMLLDNKAIQDVDEEQGNENLHIIARQLQEPSADFIDITDEASQHKVLGLVRQLETELVIVANLTTTADGLPDENDAAAMRSVMRFLMMMKQAGVATILVHHSNKNGSGFRGSSALGATFESIISLKANDNAQYGSASFVLDFEKLRAKRTDATQTKVWTLTDFFWTIEDDEQSTKGRIREAVKSHMFTNQSEIAEHLGIDKSTVSRALGALESTQEFSKHQRIEAFKKAKALKEMPAEGIPDDDLTDDLEGSSVGPDDLL
ncbi:MAG: AAA family ATPase [Cyanobacteria bacterium P01_A01_bin.17]